MRLLLVYINALLQCILLVHSYELKAETDNIQQHHHYPYHKIGNDTNTTTAAPSVTANNSTNVTTAAPSSVAPHNDTNTTTAAPSLAPSSAGNHTNVTTSAPSLAPSSPNKNVTTSAPTSSPTKKYIAPTEAPHGGGGDHPKKKKKSFIRKFFSFIGWLLLIGISLLGIAACMTHRTQIYFFLLGLMHTIREACETFTFRVSLVCAGIGRTIRSARIGDRIYDLWGRIRGLGGGGGQGNRSNFANDEDGSMLQGLLLRENA